MIEVDLTPDEVAAVIAFLPEGELKDKLQAAYDEDATPIETRPFERQLTLIELTQHVTTKLNRALDFEERSDFMRAFDAD